VAFLPRRLVPPESDEGGSSTKPCQHFGVSAFQYFPEPLFCIQHSTFFTEDLFRRALLDDQAFVEEQHAIGHRAGVTDFTEGDEMDAVGSARPLSFSADGRTVEIGRVLGQAGYGEIVCGRPLTKLVVQLDVCNAALQHYLLCGLRAGKNRRVVRVGRPFSFCRQKRLCCPALD
jgi:hypothetical protein